VVLKVDAKAAIEGGVLIKRAGKTVFITKEVPADYLSRNEGG
jgi:RNA:NAD 2'-phosphotransferase (TPT1/KptA family)